MYAPFFVGLRTIQIDLERKNVKLKLKIEAKKKKTSVEDMIYSLISVIAASAATAIKMQIGNDCAAV